MNQELGREFTSAESWALATGQTTIMDIVHGYALELDEARRQEVAVVMPSGTVLTHGKIEDEVRRSRLASREIRPVPAHSWVIGVNASSNMFA
jgi:hypothetical protein